MKSKVLLGLGLLLVMLGIFKPNISSNISPIINSNNHYVIDAPSDNNVLSATQEVVEILNNSSEYNKKDDFMRLSSLYLDIANLIELDNDDMVVKDTQAIRQVNKLCGLMLRLDIKDKYEGLPEKLQNVVTTAIGQDDVILDTELRHKASDAFRALSWAFYEGFK